MGQFRKLAWEPEYADGPIRWRRQGPYFAYIPCKLNNLRLNITPDLSQRVARLEQRLGSLGDVETNSDLAGVARFLLRSEAIASSQIEGIAPAARKIAIAELVQNKMSTAKADESADLVARNMTTVLDATTKMASSDRITLEDIESLNQSLLADPTARVRDKQNWVGRSNTSPLDAEFVPPHPDDLPELLADFVDYLNGATHSAIIQAALIHAQFETLHPFEDGNGRVGRALIQTVLVRRRLLPNSLIPISQVLSTWRDRYVSALMDFRAEGEADSAPVMEGASSWISFFVECVEQAVIQAETLADELAKLRVQWADQIDQWNVSQGAQRALRSDSAVARILAKLPATPVLTAKSAAQIHDISPVAVRRALMQLADAKVLIASGEGTNTDHFRSPELLDLITFSERALASTQFDTCVSKPNRPVPARPQQ